MRHVNTERQRMQRIAELRSDLNHKLPERTECARETLLKMLSA